MDFGGVEEYAPVLLGEPIDSDPELPEPTFLDNFPVSQEANPSTESLEISQTYEDMCRTQIVQLPTLVANLQDRYLVSVDNYIHESALGQRVNEWKKRIQPLLDYQVHLSQSLTSGIEASL